MRALQLLTIGLLSLLGQISVTYAQSENSTELVYADTYVPFDSSFSAPNVPADSFTAFPSNFKSVNRLKLDSYQNRCRRDVNHDGDTTDPGEIAKERFDSHYVGFILKNHSSELLTIDNLRYEVINGEEPSIRSSKIIPVRPVVAGAGEDVAALFPFTEAGPYGRRRFIGHSKVIARASSHPRVRFEVTGHTKKRARVRLRESIVFGFQDVKNCPQ